MSTEASKKVDFDSLPIAEQAKFILKERTPKFEEVTFERKIDFLDPNHNLSREERGRVIAMGDRTATSYANLAQKVITGRSNPEATSDFYLQYALSARSSKEISHTSILEQVNPGEDEKTGDPPIVMEGVSVLSGLRDICSLRHFAFEAFSSRGGVFPDGYWKIPPELGNTRVGSDLEAINKEVYNVYLLLTQKGLEHYLEVTPRGEDEKSGRYRWRVLNYALDESRQVTNLSFLNHLSMHPNSALSLREAIVKLSSNPLPETREIAKRLRTLATGGLPTLMKHTEPSKYANGLWSTRRRLATEVLPDGLPREVGEGKSELLHAEINKDSARIFLACFLAQGAKFSVRTVYRALVEISDGDIEDMIDEVFEGVDIHDKVPEELEILQVIAHSDLSIGAYFEAVRHRLATFVVGDFDSEAHIVPDIYKRLSLLKEYEYAIELNKEARELVKGLGSGYEAFVPYFASRADIIPVTMRISAMDAFHYLKLRASPEAHPDIYNPSSELNDFLTQNGGPIFNYLF